MRYVEWESVSVCKRGRKELSHLRQIYKNVNFNADHGWVYAGSLVISIDNLLVQSFESYSRSLLRELSSEGRLKQSYAEKNWSTRDFEDVVLSLFEAGKVSNAERDSFPISKLPPYVMKKPSELLRLMSTVPKSVPNNISNAVAANFSVFTEIKPFRNFYAHQCEATASKLKRSCNDLKGKGAPRPFDVLVNERTRSRRPFIDLWIEQLEDFFIILSRR